MYEANCKESADNEIRCTGTGMHCMLRYMWEK